MRVGVTLVKKKIAPFGKESSRSLVDFTLCKEVMQGFMLEFWGLRTSTVTGKAM
jgi:hypothetical protein